MLKKRIKNKEAKQQITKQPMDHWRIKQKIKKYLEKNDSMPLGNELSTAKNK